MEDDIRNHGYRYPTINFNPRPPHGGRQHVRRLEQICTTFQSTSSAWRTTSLFALQHKEINDFNPRPPHGGRHVSALAAAFNRSFQSTSCAWRTTMSSVQAMTFRIISIRVLRMEDDAQKRKAHEEAEAFQPTSCAWGTTSKIYSKSGDFSTSVSNEGRRQ